MQFHASDLLNSFHAGELQDYLLNFAYTLNPNAAEGKSAHLPEWPAYTPEGREALELRDIWKKGIIIDDARDEPIRFLQSLGLKYGL